MEKFINILDGITVSENGTVRFNNNELKKYLDKDGYHVVNVYRNKANKKHKVHRLVAEAFLGKNDLSVNHKNGIKTDNNVSNLEYVTHNQNDFHKWTVLRKAKCKYLGVTISPDGRYRAQIQINKKKIGLGYFNNPKIAHAVYMFNKQAHL